MKALSFHQPRAEQVVRGEKTVDIRTWRVAYRGPLAVHASAQRRDARCRALGFDPATLAYGAVIGAVDLVDIQAIDAERYATLQAQHRLDTLFPGEPCYAWFFRRPQRLPEPAPARGRRRLFDVVMDGEPVSEAPPEAAPAARVRNLYRIAPPPQPDPERPFALYAIAEEAGGGYRVALYQWVPVGQIARPAFPAQDGKPAAPGALWEIEIGGDPLRTVTDHLLAALRANGYKATDLGREVGSETPFYLDEASGLRLALIFIAVKPLARHDRIEAIGQGIQAMSEEEAYYWFSKCSAGVDATRAQKALRVLLG
ncbi:MAG: ASCH domain-containing protein [Anaerolineae bacterium]|nr:ASCH domain-containing protein [Anaerolineae bacterium]